MKLVNLLPKPRQELLKQEAVLKSLYGAIWLSLLSFAIVLGAQFAAKLYLQNQAKTIRASVVQVQGQVNKSENAKLKAEITDVNNMIADYKALAYDQAKWYKVIKAFAALPPDGVVVNSLAIEFTKKGVTITGTAPTREVVIQLYRNILADDKEFYGVDYPFENVAKPENTSFHFSFFIKDELLK